MKVVKGGSKRVPMFCETCGREEFAGHVFGRYVEVRLSPDRMGTMYCQKHHPTTGAEATKTTSKTVTWDWMTYIRS